MNHRWRHSLAPSLAGLVLVCLVGSCSDDPAGPDSDEATTFSRMIGGVNNEALSVSVAVTSGGLRIVAGTFSGVLHITGSADSLISNDGSDDVYLAAFKANGSLAWKRRYGGTGHETPLAVARDATDNIFVGGHYNEDTNFEGTNLDGAGVADVLVAKFNANGDPEWAVGGGSIGNDFAYDVVPAQDGGVFACGDVNQQFSLGGQTIGEADPAGFLVRVSPIGGVAWAVTAGGSSDASCLALARASDGSVFVTGAYFDGDLTVAGSTFSLDGGFDGFIARYSGAGSGMSAVRIGGSGTSVPQGITILSEDVVVVGSMAGTVDFDLLTSGGGETAAGGTDVFVARYRANGTLVWVRRFGSVGLERALDVSRVGDSDLLVTGLFEGALTLGATSLTTNGGDDIFMARLRSDGSVTGAVNIGSAGNDFRPRVAGAGEMAILVGTTTGETRFPDGTIRDSFGGLDHFIYQR